MVRQYQTRPVTVDAWQRQAGQAELPVWVPQFVDVRLGNQSWKITLKHHVTNRKTNANYRRSDSEREIEIEHGDWLVQDADGVYLYDDREFKKRFELIAQGPGGQ